jgi:hypothetical protein
MTTDIDTDIDAAGDILRLTDDGNALAPHHLKLLENAVNGRLNPAGKSALADLLANAMAGYVKPYLHDVEHMTIDLAGYVSWKTHQVEHFSPRYAASDAGKAFTHELAARCRIIEQRGEIPSSVNAIWHWPLTERDVDLREYRAAKDKVPQGAGAEHPASRYAHTLAQRFHAKYHVWPE